MDPESHRRGFFSKGVAFIIGKLSIASGQTVIFLTSGSILIVFRQGGFYQSAIRQKSTNQKIYDWSG
jgi:hypothetical protein